MGAGDVMRFLEEGGGLLAETAAGARKSDVDSSAVDSSATANQETESAIGNVGASIDLSASRDSTVVPLRGYRCALSFAARCQSHNLSRHLIDVFHPSEYTASQDQPMGRTH